MTGNMEEELRMVGEGDVMVKQQGFLLFALLGLVYFSRLFFSFLVSLYDLQSTPKMMGLVVFVGEKWWEKRGWLKSCNGA